ncbi:MAG: hypothetical protein HY069_01150 [Chlamydiia bacterium]|nr:hypothetical protein [Chlamydiia bacterium]
MIWLGFGLATVALACQCVWEVQAPFFAYGPWIALVLLKRERAQALWLCALAGGVVDLLSDHPMGLHAVNYVVTAAVLARFAKHFLADAPLHLGLYTGVVSFVSTWLHLFLLFLFDRRVPFAGKWALGEFLGMPILDGVYALVWFAVPLALVTKIKRYWTLFWLKRKNLSPR